MAYGKGHDFSNIEANLTQVNYGWGISLDMTGKVPAITKRIFDKYEQALEYVNNVDDSAIQGLTLTVIADSAEKNGVYFVEAIGKGHSEGKLVKLASTSGTSGDLDKVKQDLVQKITEEETARKNQDDKIEGSIGLPQDGGHPNFTGTTVNGDKTIVEAIHTIDKAIDGMDLGQTGANGSFIKLVSQANGKVSATADTFETSVGEGTKTSVKAPTTKAVYDALKAKVESLDVTDSPVATKYVSGVSETDGKIAVTRANLVSEGDKVLSVDTSKGGIKSTISITKLTEGIGDVNVREQYKLVGLNGAVLGEPINVYKDSSLESVTLEGTESNKQELVFTYIKANGEEEVVRLDVSKFLAQSEFKDGLQVNEAGQVSVKRDASSESFLSVSEAGVKVSGVQTAINDAKSNVEAKVTAEINARKAVTGIQADTYSPDTSTHYIGGSSVTSMHEADKALDTAIHNINTAISGMTIDEQGAVGNFIEYLRQENGRITASKKAFADNVTTGATVAPTSTAVQSYVDAEVETEKTNREAAIGTHGTASESSVYGFMKKLEDVKTSGSNAIAVSANGATQNKTISLTLASVAAPSQAGADNETNVSLTQDGSGLKATLQWGSF